MMGVVRIHPQLIDDFKGVFAPILYIDECVMQRGDVFALESVLIA